MLLRLLIKPLAPHTETQQHREHPDVACSLCSRPAHRLQAASCSRGVVRVLLSHMRHLEGSRGACGPLWLLAGRAGSPSTVFGPLAEVLCPVCHHLLWGPGRNVTGRCTIHLYLQYPVVLFLSCLFMNSMFLLNLFKHYNNEVGLSHSHRKITTWVFMAPSLMNVFVYHWVP